MNINRRDFVRVGTSALVGTHVLAARAHQAPPAPRRIHFRLNALSMFVLDRAKGTTGIPGTTAKVSVLFANHSEHHLTQVFVTGGNKVLVLDKADLRIKVDGQPLKPSPMTLANKVDVACPRYDQWESLSCAPVMERVLGKSVDVKNACLDQNNPTLISGRLVLESGTLQAAPPESPYSGEQWSFPGGAPSYRRSLTDVLEWIVEIGAGAVTLEVVPFGSNVAKDSVTVSPGGSLAVYVSSPRRAGLAAPSTNSMTHFVHYYDFLDHTGSVKPIPTKSSPNCNITTSVFTEQQKKQIQQFRDLRLQFQTPPDNNDGPQAEPPISLGGPASLVDESWRFASVLRSESNFCVPVIMFRPL